MWAAVFGAAVLRSFTGFGFALVAVPVLALFLPPMQVVVLTASLALCISLLGWKTIARHTDWRQMLPLLIAAGVGTALGVLILPSIPADLFQVFVGLSVLVACIGIAVRPPAHPLRWRPLPWFSGLVSGVMNGALAIPGPPMIIYAMVTELDPRRSRALLMAFFLASSTLALASYTIAGIARWQSLMLVALAFPALFLGDKLGNVLFHRYGNDLYRKVSLVMLVLLGVSITLRGLW